MNYDAFSHGQVTSKLWLCEELEPHLTNSSCIIILGCWYNILGFMLLSRNKTYYQHILGIDIDATVIPIADKVCEGWMMGPNPKIRNELGDANTYNLHGYNVVINCSTEHMSQSDWFQNIDSGALVCIQTSNIDLNDDVWKVTNPIKSLEEFTKKYPLSHTIVSATKDIMYDDWGYQRYMLIGIK